MDFDFELFAFMTWNGSQNKRGIQIMLFRFGQYPSKGVGQSRALFNLAYWGGRLRWLDLFWLNLYRLPEELWTR